MPIKYVGFDRICNSFYPISVSNLFQSLPRMPFTLFVPCGLHLHIPKRTYNGLEKIYEFYFLTIIRNAFVFQFYRKDINVFCIFTQFLHNTYFQQCQPKILHILHVS